MEDTFLDLFKHFNEFFTLFFVFPFILILGIYLTIRLRFVQISKLKMSVTHLFKKEIGQEGNISRYQAVSSVLAGNFGTGNISGMAIALSSGGPGALVWMWIITFLGAVIQYSSCLLGVKYRQKTPEGEYVGGPMYYLTHGLGLKQIGIAFSFCTILAAFAVGNFAQVNSMTLPLKTIGISPWIVGVVIAFFVGVVVLGGVGRVAKVCASVVPLMGLLYLGAALTILGVHADQVLGAFKLMFQAAFGEMPLVGGVLGYTVMKTLTTGFDRAIFATDAGTGIVPILQSGARSEHPVVDGVVALVAPVLVMIVCTTTALVLIVTGAFGEEGLQSTNMVAFAFEKVVGRPIGMSIVIIALVLFGYTTCLAWASCLVRAVGFIFGKRLIRPFLYLYILLVPIGAALHVDVVWILADIALTFMMVLNLIGVAGLSREVIRDTQEYFAVKAETVLN